VSLGEPCDGGSEVVPSPGSGRWLLLPAQRILFRREIHPREPQGGGAVAPHFGRSTKLPALIVHPVVLQKQLL